MKQYEAMFLFDPTFGSSFEKCQREVNRVMERANGKILLCGPWDERRLAYRIKGRKRGVYVLVFFEAPPEGIPSIERDAKLSEDILRVIVLRAEGLTRESMERAFPHRAEEPARSGAVTAPAPASTPPDTAQPDTAERKPEVEGETKTPTSEVAVLDPETAEPTGES